MKITVKTATEIARMALADKKENPWMNAEECAYRHLKVAGLSIPGSAYYGRECETIKGLADFIRKNAVNE